MVIVGKIDSVEALRIVSSLHDGSESSGNKQEAQQVLDQNIDTISVSQILTPNYQYIFLGHDSALSGCTGLGTTWANEVDLF